MKRRKKAKKKIDFLSIIIGLGVSGILIYSLVGNIRNNVPNSLWISTTEQLEPNLVCMVNNTYVGKEQIEIIVDDKAYYGCCEMCKQTLNQDSTSRYAKDPLTKEVVNKADAFIVLRSKENDLVHYFKSKENFEQFLQLKNSKK